MNVALDWLVPVAVIAAALAVVFWLDGRERHERCIAGSYRTGTYRDWLFWRRCWRRRTDSAFCDRHRPAGWPPSGLLAAAPLGDDEVEQHIKDVLRKAGGT